MAVQAHLGAGVHHHLTHRKTRSLRQGFKPAPWPIHPARRLLLQERCLRDWRQRCSLAHGRHQHRIRQRHGQQIAQPNGHQRLARVARHQQAIMAPKGGDRPRHGDALRICTQMLVQGLPTGLKTARIARQGPRSETAQRRCRRCQIAPRAPYTQGR